MKKALSLLITLLMVVGLAACSSSGGSGDEGDAGKKESGKSDGKYEIAVVVKVVGIDYFSVFEKGWRNLQKNMT